MLYSQTKIDYLKIARYYFPEKVQYMYNVILITTIKKTYELSEKGN